MTYFVLKCGRVFNALLGVMASIFVTVLFNCSNGLLVCSLLLCCVSMALLVYLIGFCDLFDHKAYAMKSGDNPKANIDDLAFRYTLMARNKMKNLNEQDIVMIRYRRIICGAFILTVIFMLSAPVCARYGRNEYEKEQTEKLIDFVQKTAEEKSKRGYEDVKEQIKAACDTLNHSIELIPFQVNQLQQVKK